MFTQWVKLIIALWVKFSADDILKYFSYFSQKTGYDISSKLSPKETICLKCQILFSGKNKKNIINLSSAENAQRVVKVFLSLAVKVGVHSNPQDHFVHVPYGYLKYLV